jgi:hypothetical protein
MLNDESTGLRSVITEAGSLVVWHGRSNWFYLSYQMFGSLITEFSMANKISLHLLFEKFVRQI